MTGPRARRVRRARRAHPCPTCGRRGRRKRLLCRRIRSLAHGQEASLDVRYAEYQARCGCRKSFRSRPLDVPAKAGYDGAVRRAVLDRLPGDGLNVERARAAVRRDFLPGLSSGFVYDCLDWQLRRLNLPGRRRRTLAGFSGTSCVDELHPGRHAPLLATDPPSDEVVGLAPVKVNDQARLRRSLPALSRRGFSPRAVISGGSALYPAVPAEVWPEARHQLRVFHVLQDVTGKVLEAVRRPRRGCARRGNAGRKRRRGRPPPGAGRRRAGRGPTNKERAAFLFRRRHSIVKRAEALGERERAGPGVMFGYEPGLEALWRFSQETYKVWDTDQGRRVARRRWARLKNKQAYRRVEELRGALDWLDGPRLDKTLALHGQPPARRQRTNNHAERMNRRPRFDEKARHKWRSRKSIVRFLLLRASRHAPGPKPRQPPPVGGGGRPAPRWG